MTALPNPFLNSGTSPSPAVPDTAGVAPQPPVAPAGTISVSDGGPKTPSETEGAVSVSAASFDNTEHIHEIFFYVRKLMKQPPAFVLDEARFLSDIDEEPLFLRADGYLQRREA